MSAGLTGHCLESIHETPARFSAYQEYSDRSIVSTHCPATTDLSLNKQFNRLIDIYGQVAEKMLFDQAALDACADAIKTGHVAGVTLGGKYLCSMQRLYHPWEMSGQKLSVAWDDVFDALAYHRKAEIRQSVIDFVTQSVYVLGEAFVVPVTLAGLKDKSYKVRYAAIHLAFTGGWAMTIPRLQEMAVQDSNDKVRKLADFSARLMLGGREEDTGGYRMRGCGGTVVTHFAEDA